MKYRVRIPSLTEEWTEVRADFPAYAATKHAEEQFGDEPPTPDSWLSAELPAQVEVQIPHSDTVELFYVWAETEVRFRCRRESVTRAEKK